jgi:hypothetical protein
VYFEAISERIAKCRSCNPGNYIYANTCQLANCSAIPRTTELTYSASEQYCAGCSPGCQTCHQVPGTTEVTCDACIDSSYTFINGNCYAKQCGNDYTESKTTLNMQCDYNSATDPDGTSTCAKDCLRFQKGTACESAASCTRAVFEIKSVGTNTLEFTVLPAMASYIDFKVLSSGFMLPAINRVFCSMIFEDFADEDSVCTATYVDPSPKANSKITITTTTARMAALSDKTIAKIKLPHLLVKRAHFSSNLIAFNVDLNVPINVDKTHVKKVAIIASPATWGISDYTLAYKFSEPVGEVATATWTVADALVNGVSNSALVTQINSNLASSTVIPASLLVDKLTLQVQIQVTLVDQTVHVNTGSIQFFDLPQNLVLLEQNRLVVDPSLPAVLVLSFSSPTLDLSVLEVKTESGTLVQGTDYSASVQVENKKLLVNLKPQSVASTITIDYQTGSFVPITVRVDQSTATSGISLMVPSLLGIGQDLTFWTNLGADFQVTVFAYSQNTGSLLGSSSPQACQFDNILLASALPLAAVSVPDTAILYFVFEKGTQVTVLDRRVALQSTPAPQERNVVQGTCYRDGSTLHASSEKIRLGVFRQSRISLTTPATCTHSVTFLQNNGQPATTNSDLTCTASSNKVEISPALATLLNSQIETDSFSHYYTSSDGLSFQFSDLIRFYNPAPVTLKASHLPAADPSKAVFEVLVSVEPSYNKWQGRDKTQNSYSVELALADPAMTKISLPSLPRCSQLELWPGVFRVLPATVQPSVSTVTFDGESFRAQGSQALSLDASWTPIELPVSTYLTTLTNSLAATTGSDLLRGLNMAVYTCNQAYLACKLGGSCQTSDDPIRGLRPLLWQQFDTFWQTLTDKDLFQDWTTSVLRSSFLGALTLSGDSLTDANIDAIQAELTREITSLASTVTASTAGLPRTDYRIGENLKPVLRVNLKNLEHNINAISHMLRLYSVSYTGLTDGAQYQAKMNDLYFKSIILNEIKLYRYTMPSESTVFENELIILGGATLLPPLDSTYTFTFGESLAIQLSNLQFPATKVTLDNPRNLTKLLS